MSKSRRHIVEQFVCAVSEHLADECLPVSFLPWSEDSEFKFPVDHAIAPKPGRDTLEEDQLKSFMKGKQHVACGCTFEDPAEEAAASKVLSQFAAFEHASVLIVHLMPSDVKSSRETIPEILERHSRMIELGADDVLLSLDAANTEALCQSLRKAWCACEVNAGRMHLMLDAVVEEVSQELLDGLQQQHQHLLWNSIPKALMPQMRQCDTGIVESSSRVGKYVLGDNMPTVQGVVVRAYDTQHEQKVVLKIWAKRQIFTPQELEGVYREMRFLTEVLKHPNVAHCRDFLHTKAYLYMVLDFAGEQNLATLLQDFPGKRLEASPALHCFRQIVIALEYIHSKDVAHRSLQLEHAVVAFQNGGVKVTLCDFQGAVVVRGKDTSNTLCGTVPYIAPEALQGPYHPIRCDSWSSGILLLEIAGGIGCTWATLDVGPQSFIAVFREAVLNCFRVEGCHAKALTRLGAEHDDAVHRVLEAVLQVRAAQRASMSELRLIIPDTDMSKLPESWARLTD